MSTIGSIFCFVAVIIYLLNIYQDNKPGLFEYSAVSGFLLAGIVMVIFGQYYPASLALLAFFSALMDILIWRKRHPSI
ncbi:MAG: hypothetical protein UW68_C0013G0018 [Candidatus Collierbacteria bacterium GW2011_GWB1_44_6]|uniref:Uncharacterized protein n=2 Tax=Candidatus Collieribacteriota TaxID=1752725 RepID=A0A0G1JPI2_9BACT|nr:MAG: hypothetical protein UV68_C0014G0010 [Candidatus Collierbacteria bacterium GW2011_GWC2_43_12]KKT73275.1 MAG: hypothetical protein UW68_C0013G0018 [Candidatus Collierbacteria bacterium GW2011_GWB1_44_6]KKT83607.1 MAG: hypothetical protein UW80_C0010G0004 [Microgenomates group bacterium GW2011_GWC1_44_9]